MQRKRAPGGGRKAKAGPTSPLTFRIPDDMRTQLEREAAEKEVNVSDRLLWHLRRSFNRQRDEERDPALQGLLMLIGRLAENVAGADYIVDKNVRSKLRSEWRTDLFQFRAFKFAVKKLIDTLEEPAESPTRMTNEDREKLLLDFPEHFGASPEFNKHFLEINESPEAMGAWAFSTLWTRFTHSHLPFTGNERSLMGYDPILAAAMEREYYDFQKARKALELKPNRKSLEEELDSILESLGPGEELSPEMDADIKAALKIVVEAKGKPTLEEALKIVRSKKPKGK